MTLYNDITETFGNTPLVKINNLFNESDSNVYLKLEFFNPTSSVKDRLAIAMIDDLEKKGKIKKGDLLIEATSGNTGIALAMVAASRGYRLKLTMPESMSKERRALLRAYGAELVLTPSSEGMNGAKKRAKDLAKSENGVLLDQFSNKSGPKIHYKTTGKEIWRDTKGSVDLLISGIGTGGTISGAGKYLKKKNKDIKVYGVEPLASPILNNGAPGPHIIQGIGPNFIPKILDQNIYDKIIDCPNEEALRFARELAKKEGILSGISGGAATYAASVAVDEKKYKNIVVIIPSYGERYLTTALYSDLME